MAKRYCEIFIDKAFSTSFITKQAGVYWIISTCKKNAWASRISCTHLPSTAEKISLSQGVYEWLGIPMERS